MKYCRVVMIPLLGMVAPSLSAAQQRGDYYGPHMWEGGWWHGMLFGPLMLVLVIALAVVIVALLARWLGGVDRHASVLVQEPSGKRAMDILKERFARGEIDQEEFEERRRVLGN